MKKSGKKPEFAHNMSGASKKFLILFILGFSIVFAGIIILMITAVFYGESTVNFGAVIFIGPFPIVIGTGSEVFLMILVAVVLAILSFIMLVILRKGMKKRMFRLF